MEPSTLCVAQASLVFEKSSLGVVRLVMRAGEGQPLLHVGGTASLPVADLLWRETVSLGVDDQRAPISFKGLMEAARTQRWGAGGAQAAVRAFRRRQAAAQAATAAAASDAAAQSADAAAAAAVSATSDDAWPRSLFGATSLGGPAAFAYGGPGLELEQRPLVEDSDQQAQRRGPQAQAAPLQRPSQPPQAGPPPRPRPPRSQGSSGLFAAGLWPHFHLSAAMISRAGVRPAADSPADADSDRPAGRD